jgi:hypothetical protein
MGRFHAPPRGILVHGHFNSILKACVRIHSAQGHSRQLESHIGFVPAGPDTSILVSKPRIGLRDAAEDRRASDLQIVNVLYETAMNYLEPSRRRFLLPKHRP